MKYGSCMVDRISKEQRSKNMSAIKNKNTKPEMKVRKYLHARGLRYRLHKKELDGKPDLIFSKYHCALFVHGCFWHGHNGCKNFRIPKTRSDWWETKINGNVLRDQKNIESLQTSGWKPRVIWECEIREDNLDRLYNAIVSGKPFLPFK